ncbi:MAG: putative low-complexity protein [Candidatus Endobugula sp.]|jgi:uncharacterized low-complexity protein
MSISTNKNTLALAASAALTVGLALSPMLASAETSPFASAELSNGYMQLAGNHEAGEAKCGEGKCGEGKCGAEGAAEVAAEKAAEAKCGEGKCGEGKCGNAPAKVEEAKCGEGKCGAK